jgi:hypothetical protein
MAGFITLNLKLLLNADDIFANKALLIKMTPLHTSSILLRLLNISHNDKPGQILEQRIIQLIYSRAFAQHN